MSGHRGHYMKGSGRGSLPGRFVVVCVNSGPADRTARTVGALPTRFRSASVAACHRSGSGYSRPVSLSFGSPDSLWEWLEGPRATRQRSVVLSPVASDALTLLRFWERIEAKGCRWEGGKPAAPGPARPAPPTDQYSIRRLVLRGMPDIVDYTISGRSFRWLSTLNFFRDTEDKVAKATGYKWRSISDADDTADFVCDDDGDRALMWMHAIATLALWWRDRAAGRFPATLASMGYAFLRSRIPPKTLASHKNPDVLSLERKCCHGGRSTAWYTGDVRPRGRHTKPETLSYPSSGGAVIPGPIHLLDIRSMYPSLMRDHDFPVKYSHSESNITPETLASLCKMYHCIARVALDTEIAEYPHRTGERIVYPTGRFTSYLTTPELVLALSEGAVRRVHEVSCYYRGRPFVRAATEMLQLRADAEAAGNKSWAKFVKGISTTVTGKLAQRKGEWTPVKDVLPLLDWGEWPDIDRTTGKTIRYRGFAGLVSRYDQSERGTGTHTAAYAVLVAHGRVLMRSLRSLCPPRSVLSQDTDGIWVTGHALARVPHTPVGTPALAGQLGLRQSVTSARFWDSSHYHIGGSWVLAGMSRPKFDPGTTCYVDSASLNPVRSCPLAAPSEVIELKRKGTLECTVADGVHGPDGWMTPYRLPGGAPTRPAPTPPVQGDLYS